VPSVRVRLFCCAPEVGERRKVEKANTVQVPGESPSPGAERCVVRGCAPDSFRRHASRSRPKQVPARLDATTALHPRAGTRGPRPCRRCAISSKMRTVFEECASWKTSMIPSKMRTLFQGAHRKVRIFEGGTKIVCQTGPVGTAGAWSRLRPGSHSGPGLKRFRCSQSESCHLLFRFNPVNRRFVREWPCCCR
jgi:hypothetical protein